MVADVWSMLVDWMFEITGAFETVTVIVEVALLFAASLAVAARVWEPLDAVVVFQVIEYGEVVSSVLRFTPFNLN